MLLRLAYLGITNAFALLRLLPGSDPGKDAEILALRHQLAVLHRQLGGQRVRFEPADRAWLAALLSTLPRPALLDLRLFGPTLYCAGIVTCMPAVTPRRHGPAGGAGHAPSARTRASPTPGHSRRYPNRSPTRTGSPT
jgi:hypothetical protein